MKKQKLNIKFLHDCLLIEDILVIGDLHIGYDEQFDGKAIFPGMQLKEIIEKLDSVFCFLEKEKIKIKKIILLGDVKHDFGTITDIELRETLQFLDYLKRKVNEKGIIIIKGNHDNMLEFIVGKRNLKLLDYYCIRKKGKKICFLHGDKLFKHVFKQGLNIQTDVLVFGHLHSAITLYNKYKKEKYKCFLKGNWKDKEVYILPGFSSFSYGYNIREIISKSDRKINERKIKQKGKLFDFIVPNRNLKNFEVIIYNDKEKKEYNFGKLKELI